MSVLDNRKLVPLIIAAVLHKVGLKEVTITQEDIDIVAYGILDEDTTSDRIILKRRERDKQ